MNTAQDEFIGQMIDRYQIQTKLGEGGMATVYRGLDTRLGRQVAIKVVRKGQFSSEVLERVLKRFQREARSQADLSHPNIVGLIDAGEHQGSPYLVLEYMPGGSLASYLGRQYSYQDAARLLLPIARALAYAHERGIVHRDVKPSNILFTSQGDPMLSDFGIARILGTEEITQLTSTGMGVGTPQFMSPEQWIGDASPQSDQYALGVILYELLTGRRPYEADTPGALILKQHNEPPTDPFRYAPQLPKGVRDVLLKALAHDPQNRFKDMASFARILDALALGKLDAIRTDATPVELPRSPDPKLIREVAPTMDIPPKPRGKKSIPWKRIAGVGGILIAFILVASLAVAIGMRMAAAQAENIASTQTAMALAVRPAVTKTATAATATLSPSLTPSPTWTDTPTLIPTSTPLPPTPTYTLSPTPTEQGCARLLTPANKASLATVGKQEFTWEAMIEAVAYQIIFTLPNGDMIRFDETEPSHNRYMETLVDGGEFQWQVIISDYSGAICQTEIFTFTKKEYVPPTKTPEPQSPTKPPPPTNPPPTNPPPTEPGPTAYP